MRQTIIYILTFGLILLVPIGCISQRSPIECSQIQEKELRALMRSESVTLAEASEWLHHSSFKDFDITGFNSYNDDTKGGSWGREDGPWYVANFRNDILTRVDVSWESSRKVALEPTADEIISCFGTPDFYLAGSYFGLDGDSVILSLWYLEEGIVVFSKQLYYEDKNPVIDGNVIMSNMTLTTPDKIEAMVNQIYTYGFSNSDRATVVKLLKPWPNTWDKIVIDRIKVGE